MEGFMLPVQKATMFGVGANAVKCSGDGLIVEMVFRINAVGLEMGHQWMDVSGNLF